MNRIQKTKFYICHIPVKGKTILEEQDRYIVTYGKETDAKETA